MYMSERLLHCKNNFSDLFQRAIMQSGSDRSEWAIIKSNNDAQHYAKELARELGCPTGDTYRLTKCLTEHRSYGEIVNASSKVRLKVGIQVFRRIIMLGYPKVNVITNIDRKSVV